MGKSTARIHMDATGDAGDLRASLCGMVSVSTTHDASLATCRLCLARLRGEKPDKQSKAGGRFMDAHSLAAELHLALGLGPRDELAPMAPPPPRLTPKLWLSSCRGGQAPCRDCELCAWHAEAERWAYASPWTKRHAEPSNEHRPRWPSVSAALRALVEYEQTGRDRASPLGAMLERAERQEHSQQQQRRLDRELRVADDVVHVRKALEQAYEMRPQRLAAPECVRLLLERTPGILPALTPYDVLATRLRLPVGELQSIVRRGRRALEEDLAVRGLVGIPRSLHRVATASVWSAADAF